MRCVSESYPASLMTVASDFIGYPLRVPPSVTASPSRLKAMEPPAAPQGVEAMPEGIPATVGS